MGILTRIGEHHGVVERVATLGELASRRYRPAGERPELGPDGFPLDRTVCPACCGSGCRKCRNTGLVCPTCRGARAVRAAQQPLQVAYDGCSDCTDWLSREHRWVGNWPEVTYAEQRECAAIVAAWEQQRRTLTSGPAPWEETAE